MGNLASTKHALAKLKQPLCMDEYVPMKQIVVKGNKKVFSK